MSDPKGYYKILGLQNNCSDDEIKQAYRKLAMKWHPDRNKDNKEEAEEQFKKISESYTILSDKNKRKLYDLGVTDEQMGFSDFNFNDLNFPGIFNMSDMFANKPKNMVLYVNITLEDIYYGKTIEKEIEKKILCSECNANGFISNPNFYTCQECEGTGEIMKLEQLLPGMMRQIKRRCLHCEGTGKKLDAKSYCKKCNGKKCFYKKFKKNIIIEKGLSDNSQLIYENEGFACLKSKSYGKLIINIIIDSHSRFKRIGDHLLYENEIDLVDALCGYNFNITKLNGEIVNCSSNKILSPYNIQIVYNEGLPVYKKNNYGHLIIKSKIIFPKEIPEKRKEFIYKTLAKNPTNFEKDYQKQKICHILDESQSNELIDRINNKNYNYQEDYTKEDNPDVQCVQM